MGAILGSVSEAIRVAISSIWSITAVDIAMLLTICLFIWAALKIIRKDFRGANKTEIREARERFIAVSGIIAVFIATYVAYGSFRNQLRITAEISLNEEGSNLFNLEMDDGVGLRCIYDNYGHYDPKGCLDGIVRNPDRWSKAIFYVEEGLFIITKAHRDRQNWGSNYASEIDYWAQDISRDPTGLFSYYIVSSEDSLADAKAVVKSAGICIPDLCEGYNKVRIALPRDQRDRQRALVCVSPEERREARMQCKDHR